MIWQIFIVAVLVVANGFFVAAEFALVKVRASEIESTAGGNSGPARLAKHMLNHLNVYLSACQLGITLASLGLGWAGEPMVASLIEPAFAALGLPEDKVHFFAFPIAFVVITFLHLTIGEQAPKIGAIQKARATTLLVVYPLNVFYTIFKPFIWILNLSSNAMLRMVGLQSVSEHDKDITEDEVRTILTQSAAMGHLKAGEQQIMERVLDLEEKIGRRYMVPRQEIEYLDRRDSIQQKLEIASKSGYTRLPLCDGDMDDVIGVVHVKDVFNAMNQEDALESLTQVARPPLFLPETIRLDKLLKQFQKSGRYEVDAGCSVDEFGEKCGADVSAITRVDSVGGIMTEALERIPREGDTIVLGRHRLTVLEAEPTRAKRVLVEELPEKHDPGSGGRGIVGRGRQ